MHPKEFCTKYALTQDELADLLGVSPSLVKQWVSPSTPRTPEQRHLDRLSEIDTLIEILKMLREMVEILTAKLPPHLSKLLDLR